MAERGAGRGGLVIVTEAAGEVWIVRLAGRLDRETAGSLDAAVDELFEDRAVRGLALDCERLDVVDDVGIASIMRAHDQAARTGRSVFVLRPSPGARDVLERAGLTLTLVRPEPPAPEG